MVRQLLRIIIVVITSGVIIASHSIIRFAMMEKILILEATLVECAATSAKREIMIGGNFGF